MRSFSYFRSWVGMPIKWRGAIRRPISENWHSVAVRSSRYHLACNRTAAHPVTVILNYAYAALESAIRIKAISEGYDPTIGVMHEGRDGSSVLDFARHMFSIQLILSFAAMVFAGLIQK
jgi:CRISPR-associated protein Cas1